MQGQTNLGSTPSDQPQRPEQALGAPENDGSQIQSKEATPYDIVMDSLRSNCRSLMPPLNQIPFSLKNYVIAKIDTLSEDTLEAIAFLDGSKWKGKTLILVGEIACLKERLEADDNLKKVNADIINAYSKVLEACVGLNNIQSFQDAYHKIKSKVDSALYPENENINKLHVQIQTMMMYGEGLISKDVAKGLVAFNLAEALQNSTDSFFKDNDISQEALDNFKQEFTQKLDEKNELLSQYRANWKTIALNVAIALSGIGLVAIAAHLAYTKHKNHRALLFFAKKQTQGEERALDLQTALSRVSSPTPSK